MKTPFDTQGADLRCHCPGMGDFDGIELCACPAGEKVIRAYAKGKVENMMTPEQRKWCLYEIGRVEGYGADDYGEESDRNLARIVLSAWADFCRDKGLF